MGIHTRIYRLNDDLAINIPSNVLPPGRMQLIEERVETPGYEAETTAWYPLLTGRRAKDGRLPMFIPYEVMQGLGLDPNKDVYIRLYGYGEWLRSHVHHRWPYKTVRDRRVWIPSKIVDRLKIPEYEYYDAIIRGTTMPRIEIILVEREVRVVIVRHHGKDYETENYAANKWRWIIPREIECHPVLETALGMFPPRYPLTECHLAEDEIIYVDFFFYKESARDVSEKVTYLFRNLACRNYTCTEDVSYPFLAELRCSYYSCCPKDFYQTEERFMPLKQALEITVYNMLQYFFEPAKPGQKYSTMSYAEHIGKIDYTTTRVYLPKAYPRVENVPKITAPGEEVGESEITENKYYSAIKYVRVLNENAYRQGNPDMYVYTDVDITAILLRKIESRMLQGLPPLYTLDHNGFLWRA